MNLSYHIYYSKEYKIYDLVIKKDNKFFSNYHIHNKKDLIKLINNKNQYIDYFDCVNRAVIVVYIEIFYTPIFN